MTTQDIKKGLLEGKTYGNDLANWYTLCNPEKHRFIIVIGEKFWFCKNIDSAARRIKQLLNRGY